jgi:cysteine-rich repeat protein
LLAALGAAAAVAIAAPGCDQFLPSRCGDTVVDADHGETCDDGNVVDGDGCDSNCTLTACGNGVLSGSPGFAGKVTAIDLTLGDLCAVAEVDGESRLYCGRERLVLAPLRGVTDASVGWGFECAVAGGSAFCRGYDRFGQLGSSSFTRAVDLESRVVEVAAGPRHACARLEGGSTACWGANQFGQLGRGTHDETGEPGGVDLGGQGTVGAVGLSAGDVHTCALLEDGSVKCWGYNELGQLGQGHRNNLGDEPGELGDSLPPVDLGGVPATEIAAGYAHTCALLADGNIKCWGGNFFGELGQGHDEHLGDEPGELGDALPPVDLGANGTARAIAIAAGGGSTCALLEDRRVKCWGYVGSDAGVGDQPGELGDALPPVDFGAAAAGRVQVVAVDIRDLAPELQFDGLRVCAIFDGNVICRDSDVAMGGSLVSIAAYEEGCDDGNTTAGDGCGASCEIEPGWSCDGAGPSACDRCGNAHLGGEETCDDGNQVSGDGCGFDCRAEECLAGSPGCGEGGSAGAGGEGGDGGGGGEGGVGGGSTGLPLCTNVMGSCMNLPGCPAVEPIEGTPCPMGFNPGNGCWYCAGGDTNEEAWRWSCHKDYTWHAGSSFDCSM